MKVAMFTNNYLPFIGGVPISIDRLANGLRALGHEVTVFAPEYGSEKSMEKDVVRYASLPICFRNGMVIPNFLDPKIHREFVNGGFDVIHVHQPFGIGNVAVHLSRKYQIPLVFTYHTQYGEYLHYLKFMRGKQGEETKICGKVREYVPVYMNHFMEQCSLVFAPSVDMKNYLMQKSGMPLIKVLPTGLEPDAFQKNKETSEALRRKYIGDKAYLLCVVSRLEKEKNLYFLLDSLCLLKEKSKDNFRFLMIGDGGERALLEEYARKRGLGENVIFTGAVINEEVKDYLGACDLFAFSSKSETQGIVLAEAMAAGLPVVALEAVGVRDIVRDGENGFMTPECEERFADAVCECLKREGCKERFSQCARQTAAAYRKDKVARQAIAGYKLAISAFKRKQFERQQFDRWLLEYRKFGSQH